MTPHIRVAALIISLSIALVGCGPDEAAIEHAISIRTELGLRADRDHVIRVMQDPTAVMTYGAPLLPAEAAEAESSGWASSEVGPLTWYGVQHADEFGGIYQDGATIVLMFTGSIEAHIQAVGAIAPAATIRVERVDHTEAELFAIMDRVQDDEALLAELGIELHGHGLMTMENRVALDAKAPNPVEAERWLEDRYGAGFEATVLPLPAAWAQEAAGPGWRLLAQGPWGRSFSVSAAQTPDELDTHWSEWLAPGDPPAFDSDSEIVAMFGWTVGSSCPEARLDGVVFDRDNDRVHGQFSDPLGPRECTSDARPHTFVVALDRRELPASSFELWLWEGAGDLACCTETAKVEVRIH